MRHGEGMLITFVFKSNFNNGQFHKLSTFDFSYTIYFAYTMFHIHCAPKIKSQTVTERKLLINLINFLITI